MVFKHVLRSFKRHGLKFLLLGLIIGLSSFVYAVFSFSLDAIRDVSESYFDAQRQESIAITFVPYATEKELRDHADHCDVDVVFLEWIAQTSQECYDAIMMARFDAFQDAFPEMIFEWRRFKDASIQHNDILHSVRVFKDTQQINLSYMDAGEKPKADYEVAITQTYADYHGLTIGDTVILGNQSFVISGFVLFPDYNLPVIDETLLIDSKYRTLALTTDQTFEALAINESRTLGGYFKTIDAATFDERFRALDETITATVLEMVHTEHNMRSGAVYTELEASEATMLFLSVFLAGIGIVIITIVVAKTVQQEQIAIGVIKALGLSNRALLVPYIVVLGMYALVWLSIGVAFGYVLATPMRDLYLTFYLLPHEDVRLSWQPIMVAILVPMVVIIGVLFMRLRLILGRNPMAMLKPQVRTFEPKILGKILAPLRTIDVRLRLKFSVMFRTWGKTVSYALGVLLAIVVFMFAFALQGVFGAPLEHYYDTVGYDRKAHCPTPMWCNPDDGDKVIEIRGSVAQYRVKIIGLDASREHYPLRDARGNTLSETLQEGVVITESFAELSQLRKGDEITLSLAGQAMETSVLGIADYRHESIVYVDRETLGKTFFNDADYFNTLHIDAHHDASETLLVTYVDDVLKQSTYLNQIMNQMVFVLVIGAALMGGAVVYLLTMMRVEDHAYEMRIFEVLGYTKKEVKAILLGGYQWLNGFLFIVSALIAWIAFDAMRRLMAMQFDVTLDLRLQGTDIIYSAMLLVVVFTVSSINARKHIDAFALNEALARFRD